MKSWLFLIRELLCMRSIHPYWLQCMVLNHYDMVGKFYDHSHQLVEESHVVDATLSYGKTFQQPEKDSIVITLHYDQFFEKQFKPFYDDAVGRPVTVVVPPSQPGAYEFFKEQLDDMLKFPNPVVAQFDFGFDLHYQNLNVAEMLNRYRCDRNLSNSGYQSMKNLLENIVEQYSKLQGTTPVEYLRKTSTNIEVKRENEKTFSVSMTCFPQTDCKDDDTMEYTQTGFTHLGEVDMWIGVPNTALSLMSGVPFAAYLDFTGWNGTKYGALLGGNVQNLIANLK